MDVRQLGKTDLNLLVALQVLLEERHVSRAAARLHVTQSAMSKTLGRLRELFDDPLFTRKGGVIVPTPRAEQLQSALSGVLADVQALVAPPALDPSTWRGEFRLIMPDHIAFIVIPQLMALLAVEAPGVRLRLISPEQQHLELLASGEVDMIIQIARHQYGDSYDVVSLGTATPMLIARAGHPLQNREYGWDDVCAYPHVRLFVPDFQAAEFFHVETEIIKLTSKVEWVLETSHLFTALEVISRTDYLMRGSPLMAAGRGLVQGVVALPLPLKISELGYALVSHERTRHSPMHDFLRKKMLHAMLVTEREFAVDMTPISLPDH